MTQPQPRVDLARISLLVLIIAGLTAGALAIVRPFITPILWSGVVVMATWPLMLWVQRRLWGRRALATLVMTAALVLIFIVPLVLAGATIIMHLDDIGAWIRSLAASPPAPPEWLRRVPLAGEQIARTWTDTVSGGVRGLAQRLLPYLDDAARWVGVTLGGFGALLAKFILVVVVAAILFVKGEAAADGVMRVARRLAGERGEEVCKIATRAIRAVALGVVVTALVQALLAGIGLAICGVPIAALLTAAIFLLSIAQLGAILVLAPAVLWLFYSGDTIWGVVLAVWTVVVGNIDNVLRPILIQREAKLPLLLVFVGVVGGLLAFGLMGVFVGPVLLAVVYQLLAEWVREGEPPPGAAAQPSEAPDPSAAR
jgi:predicted PurR-regulated permease PerM